MSGAATPESDASRICARWRRANTFDWRDMRRSRTASSPVNSLTKIDGGRATHTSTVGSTRATPS